MCLCITKGKEADNGDDVWRWTRFGSEAGVKTKFTTIIQSPDSTLWAASPAGIYWFDGYQWNIADSSHGIGGGEFSPFFIAENGMIGFAGPEGIYEGGKSGFHQIAPGPFDEAVPFGGNSLLLRYGASLQLWRSGKIIPMENYPAVENSHTDPALWYTHGGHVWLNAHNGLYYWDRDRWVCKVSTPSVHLNVTNVVEYGDGSIVYVVRVPESSRGVWKIEKDGMKKQIYSSLTYCRISPGPDIQRSAISITSSFNIEVYDHNKLTRLKYFPLEGTEITTTYRSYNGDLWFGTDKGLYLYRASSHRWIRFGNPAKEQNNVLELIHSRNGELWAGTLNGLDIYYQDSLVRTIDTINGESIHTITGLAEDSTGNIWVSSGSAFRGAYRWNGFRWLHVLIDSVEGGPYIHKIRIDREGRIWFLGLGQNYDYGRQPGAYIYEHGKFRHWTDEVGLNNVRVYSFDESADGSQWLGASSGLYCWNGNRLSSFSITKDGLFSPVFTIAIDRKNNVWFSNRDGIIGYLQPNGIKKTFGIADGLPSDIVWDIRLDSSGAIWVSTPKGISSFRDNIWTSYDAKNGFFNFPCWPLLITGNKVYAGTLGKGLVCLHPEECVQPPTLIDLDNSIVEGANVFLRWHPLGYGGEPEPENILTRFRVNHDEWSNWSTSHDVSLHYTEPGSHFFQVQAMNLFGAVDSNGVLGTFIIPPPLYYRPVFLISNGILLIGIIVVGFVYVRRIKTKDKALSVSEAKFRKLTESTFDGILIHEKGTILEANESLARMFGYEPSGFVGKNMHDLLPKESWHFDDRITVDGVLKPFESEGIRNDGSRIWIEVIENSIPYGKGLAQIAAIRNITGRKLSEEQFSQYRDELKSLVLEISTAEERERKKIASYLHDYLSQALGYCKMKLGTMKENATEHDLAEIRSYVEEMFEKTQTLTFELSPPILYELGLEPAVEALTERMQKQYDMPFHIETDSQLIPMDEKISILLFYAIRELLINAVKHADADEVTVAIHRADDMMRISVTDDGKGFAFPGRASQRRIQGGFGLFNIQERLTHLGGHLEIVSGAEKGTIISIVLPLKGQNSIGEKSEL